MWFEDVTRWFSLALHIPDGFLSVPVSIAWWVLTVAMIGLSLRNTTDLNERQVPLMGVMAAFIFAGQMLNFPVPGGTSGHLLGGALAALLLGPWAGALVLACVVGLQALLFQDGGLVVMGANIFNMGILTAFVGWAVGIALLRAIGNRPWALVGASFVAAWVSIMAAAALTALQLALSGVDAAIVFPPMLIVHAVIGIGEGLITATALAFIVTTRPDLVAALPDRVTAKANKSGMVGAVIGVGLVAALGAALLSPLASGAPDGLERVAEDTGFSERAQDAPYRLLPDYTIPGMEGGISTILSAVIGLLIVFALVYGVTMILRGRKA
jgi:cobalt/nickel transport system permease protein